MTGGTITLSLAARRNSHAHMSGGVVEMIVGAGLGIAMQNAAESVLDVADDITASNDEDGVARAIERFLL